MLSFEKDFRQVQHYLVNYVYEKPYSFLGVDMGMGKTAVALTLAKKLLQGREVSKILIVAPKRVAKHTWPDEVAAWDHLSDLKFSVILGEMGVAVRALAAMDTSKIHITNRENLPWLWEFFKKGKKWPYDMLIYDEASRLKSWKKRTAAGALSELGVLSIARKKSLKRVLLLSGTPSPNGILDLGGPLYILDGGERLGTSMSEYKQRYFEQCLFSYKCTPWPFAFEEIMQKIQDVMITMKTEDYVKLPQAVYTIKMVKLDAENRKKYNTLIRNLYLEDYDLVVANQAVLIQKLLQLCNGSIYVTDEKTQVKTTYMIHSEKLNALEEIVKAEAGKPLLVAYSFQFDRDAILNRFKNAELFDDANNSLKRWNEGKIPMLVAHSKSIGHGMNLQKGSNIAVWYGLTWSLELYQQFNKRLVRPGQTEDRVIIYHILTEGTYECKVYDTLCRKEGVQNDVLETLKVHKETVLGLGD